MIHKIKSAILIAVTSLLIISCNNESKPAPDLESAKKDIQAMEDAFAAAEKEKNAAKVVEYYSEDAVSYGRDRQPDNGKAAIQERIAKRLAEDTTGNYNVYKVVDLFGEGDMLVEIGSWTEMSPAGTEVNNGHYLSYFQKRDGKYLCVRDMSVNSNPPKQ